MPSLKSLRMRINSVKSTRKITQAMKMVAAAKLRRAQSRAEAARPYAERMERMLASLGAAVAGSRATAGLPVPSTRISAASRAAESVSWRARARR